LLYSPNLVFAGLLREFLLSCQLSAVSLELLASSKCLTFFISSIRLVFLGRAGGAGEDAEDFFFLHDDELFAINLDLGAGVLAEQDAVALFDGQREGFCLRRWCGLCRWR